MDYTHQPAPAASHYAAPPTYYLPPASASASAAPTIGAAPNPNPNPNPRSDQVPAEVPVQGVDASVTSLAVQAVSQYYAAAAYGSYEASVSGAALANAHVGYMPIVGPSPQVKRKKANHVVIAQDVEAKKQKLIKTGADANSVRACTICNVVCNSETAFASHIASEKHISRVNGNPSKGLALYTGRLAVHKARSNVNKKLKKKKTNTLSAVVAPRVAQSVYCDICKTTCNTQEMYNNHVSGKKHNKNIKNRTGGDGLIEFVPARSTSPGTQAPCTNVNVNEEKSVYCDLCKVRCDTLVMYNNHVAGKKHNKNIKNLTMDDKPNQSVPATSTSPGIQTPATNDNDQEHVPSSSEMPPKPNLNGVSKEDLETKKKKILESGANGSAVKVCELCNIVCNSPKVFEYHCAGQKHKSMVKKQEENLGDGVKCDLCNIVCNSPKVFESHCMGQKHRNMVKKQEEKLSGSVVVHYAEPPAVVSAQVTAAASSEVC